VVRIKGVRARKRRWPDRLTDRERRTHTYAPIERIPSPLTLASDLGKQPCAQR
jgi:hypothetical protein